MMEKCRLFFRRDLLSTDRSNIGHAPHTSEARRYQVKKIERESTCFDVTRNQGRRGLVGMVSYITWKGEKNFFFFWLSLRLVDEVLLTDERKMCSTHTLVWIRHGKTPTKQHEKQKKVKGAQHSTRDPLHIVLRKEEKKKRKKNTFNYKVYLRDLPPRLYVKTLPRVYNRFDFFLFNRWALLKVTHTKLLERYQQGFESILWYGEGKGICLSGAERGICWCGKRAAGKRKPKSMFVRDTSF